MMKLRKIGAFLLAICLSLNVIPVHAEEAPTENVTEEILRGDGYVCKTGGTLWVPLFLPEGTSADNIEITSSDINIATASYSEGGISVKFVGTGTVVITVTTADGLSDSMTITVEERNDPTLLFGGVQTINTAESETYTFTPPSTGWYCFRLESPVTTMMIVQQGDQYVTSAYYPTEQSATAKLDAGVSYTVLFWPETENKSITLTAWVEEGSAPPPSHDGMLIEMEAEPATCIKDGVVKHWLCFDCGKTFSDAKGTKELEDVTIPAAHQVTRVEAKEPTYTSFGHIEHWKCDVCGWLFSDSAAWRRVWSVAVQWLVEVEDETASVKNEAIAESLQAEYQNKTLKNLVIPVKDGSDATISAVSIPAESLEMVRDAAEALTMELDSATVTMDAAAMDAVLAQIDTAPITLSVQQTGHEALNEQQQTAISGKKVAMVISASVTSGDVSVHDFKGGKVTLKIPFALPEGITPEDYTILYLADDGSVEEVGYEHSKDHLTMVLDHFSEYALIQKVKETIPETSGPEEAYSETTGSDEVEMEPDNGADLLLLVGITVIAAAAAMAIFAIRKKRGKN